MAVHAATTPHPTPSPPRGEGTKSRESQAFDSAFDVAVLWTFPPSGCAEHRSLRRTGPRADAGQGRKPKISPTGHGWPVGETRRGREAQTSGKCSLVTFLRQESNPPSRRNRTFNQRLQQPARKRVRKDFRVHSAASPRLMRFAALSTSLYLIAVPETRRVQDEVDKLSTS